MVIILITGYKIKNINNEEVLYIYLDFNYELGSFKNIKSSLKKTIKEFIEKNRIAFKGTMVALVVGGMVTGSMSLKENSKNFDIDNQIMISEKVLDNISIPDEIVVDKTTENAEEEKVEEIINDTSIVKEDQNSNIDYKNNIKEESKVLGDKKVAEEPVVLNQKQVILEAKEEIQTQKEEIVDNKTYVTIRRSNGEYQNIELEEYIIGVVGAEMPASFQNEALKSQAIIARTYALKALSRGQTLTDNESTQSFKDINQLRNMWGSSFDNYYNKIRNAVLSTEGLYLTYNGNYIEAVYHSTSNGITENSVNVWGNTFPYLVSVDSPYDSDNPSFTQTKSFSYEEISDRLGINIDINTDFSILDYTSGNRVESIRIGEKNYKGITIRQLLGLRSTDFEIDKTAEGIKFTTRGYGHGVGLSQYGANGMAKNGYSYIQILLHYYPGVTIN